MPQLSVIYTDKPNIYFNLNTSICRHLEAVSSNLKGIRLLRGYRRRREDNIKKVLERNKISGYGLG
jgi:hypothetical protein